MLIGEPVGDVKNDKQRRGQPHRPCVDVVANGLGVGIHGRVDRQQLQRKKNELFPTSPCHRFAVILKVR